MDINFLWFNRFLPEQLEGFFLHVFATASAAGDRRGHIAIINIYRNIRKRIRRDGA